jgi:hypothetical protein
MPSNELTFIRSFLLLIHTLIAKRIQAIRETRFLEANQHCSFSFSWEDSKMRKGFWKNRVSRNK